MNVMDFVELWISSVTKKYRLAGASCVATHPSIMAPSLVSMEMQIKVGRRLSVFFLLPLHSLAWKNEISVNCWR